MCIASIVSFVEGRRISLALSRGVLPVSCGGFYLFRKVISFLFQEKFHQFCRENFTFVIKEILPVSQKDFHLP